MSQVTCMIYQNKASGQRVLFLSLKHVSILVQGHPQASSSLINVGAKLQHVKKDKRKKRG